MKEVSLSRRDCGLPHRHGDRSGSVAPLALGGPSRGVRLSLNWIGALAIAVRASDQCGFFHRALGHRKLLLESCSGPVVHNGSKAQPRWKARGCGTKRTVRDQCRTGGNIGIRQSTAETTGNSGDTLPLTGSDVGHCAPRACSHVTLRKAHEGLAV